MKPYDEQWRLEQAKTIGGSSAAAVFGQARFTTPMKLWEKMRAARAGTAPPETLETDAMHAGRVYEPLIREKLAEYLGSSVYSHPQTDFITHPQYPYAHVLPDGFLSDGTFCEIKACSSGVVARALINGLFPEWLFQSQHTMMLTDTDTLVFALWNKDAARLHVWHIARDDEFIADLADKEEAFSDSVDNNEPPGSEVAERIDVSGAKERFDDPEIVQAAQALIRLREIESDTKEALAAAKARLLERVGDECTGFIVSGVGSFSHSAPVRRRTFDRALAEREFPALKDPRFWRLGEPSRSFRAYAFDS